MKPPGPEKAFSNALKTKQKPLANKHGVIVDSIEPAKKQLGNFFDETPEQRRKEKLELKAGTLCFNAIEAARGDLCSEENKRQMQEKLASETLNLLRQYLL